MHSHLPLAPLETCIWDWLYWQKHARLFQDSTGVSVTALFHQTSDMLPPFHAPAFQQLQLLNNAAEVRRQMPFPPLLETQVQDLPTTLNTAVLLLQKLSKGLQVVLDVKRFHWKFLQSPSSGSANAARGGNMSTVRQRHHIQYLLHESRNLEQD